MRVRFNQRWWRAITPATAHQYVEGQEVDLPDDVARQAIAAGVAVSVNPTPADDEDGA